MFIGHYSAALAAKAAEPRAPLWVYVGGCQLLDIAWSVAIMTGVEKVGFDPALPGSVLVLESMPYTHSLPASLLWSLAAALAVRFLMRLPWRAAVAAGLVVFSHWVLDFVCHRPDLELWFGGTKVGLGWWNFPMSELALELGLVALAAAAWTARRVRMGQPALPALVFLLNLIVVQIVSLTTPAPSDPIALGRGALIVFLYFTALAWLVERERKVKSAKARAAA